VARIAFAVGIGVLGAVTGGLGYLGFLGSGFAEGGVGAAIGGGLLGFSIGNTVGNALFPVHLPGQFGPRLGDLSVSTSTNGAFIPIGYGTVALGSNIFWSPGLVEHSTSTTSGGKGGPTVTTTTYNYTISFAAGFGEGPGTVIKVWGDAKVLYDGSGGAYVNFLGDFVNTTPYQVGDVVKYSGKYYRLAMPWGSLPFPSPTTPPFGSLIWNPYNGTIITTSTQKYPAPTLYSGTGTQMPDPTIQANVGADKTSAFRGLIYVVWTDLPLADFGNRLPNIRGVVNFGAVGSVAPVGFKSGSLSAWGWNHTTSGAFDKAATQVSSDFSFTPASLHWQGETGQNTQVATLNSSGVVVSQTDTGHYENWEAAITGMLTVNEPGTYRFNLSHDDGAYIGFKATGESGGTVTKISGTVVNVFAGSHHTARENFVVMAGNNNSGSWPSDPFSFSISGGTYPQDIKFEIDWTNWEHRSRMILTTDTGAEIVEAQDPTASVDTTSVEFIVKDICSRSNIDSSLVEADDLIPVAPTVSPAPGTLTNTVHASLDGGLFWWYWSMDVDNTNGVIWNHQGKLLTTHANLFKTTLSNGVLSTSHRDMNAKVGLGPPNQIMADPVDGTVLFNGTVTGNYTFKYDWDNDTVVAQVANRPLSGNVACARKNEVKDDETYMATSNAIYSAADLSLVHAAYPLVSGGSAWHNTATVYDSIYDEPSQLILAAIGNSAGVARKTAKFDLNDQTPTGLTILVDADSEANPSPFTNATVYPGGLAITPDGAYGVSNAEGFLDFYDMATLTLIAHVDFPAYPNNVPAWVAVDDYNIAYVVSSSNGKTVKTYDCATGASLGNLGTFSAVTLGGFGALRILYHPTEGTWLIGTDGLGGGNIQAMFIRGVPEGCKADPITPCDGYLISRPSDGRTLLTQLAQAYFFDVVESDFKVKAIRRGVHASVMTIPEDDLGLVKDKAKLVETVKQEQDASQTVTILHFDASIDYQQGKQEKRRSSRVVKTRNQSVIELPIVMPQSQARGIADKTLYLQWLERKPYSFNLWKAVYAILDPTDVVDFIFEDTDYQQRITTSTIGQDYSVQMTGVSHESCAYQSVAPGGTPGGSNAGGTGVVIPTVDGATVTTAFLFDLPYLRDTDASLDRLQTGIYWMLTSESASWPGGVLLQSETGSVYLTLGSSGTRASYGVTTGTLADPPEDGLWTWDTTSTLNISMTNGTLAGVTDADVLAGANPLLVGNELIQFVDCVQEMDGTFTISRLLRGRRNTEPFATGHSSAETVVVPDSGLQRSVFADNFIGKSESYKAVTVGADPTAAPVQTLTSAGNDLKPASPVHIVGVWDSFNNMTISWIRRTRFGGKGLVGPTPLNEDFEAYQIDVYNGVTLERTIHWTGSVDGNGNPVQFYSAADQTTDGFTAGTDPVTVKIYQMSAQVGRGFPATATIDAVVGTITGITTGGSGGSGGTGGSGGGTGGGSTGAAPFDCAFFFNGAPDASFEILRIPVDRPLTLPAGLLGSQAVCKTAPTGDVTMAIKQTVGVSTTTLGTINFAAGETVATFTFDSAVTLQQGDILTIEAPTGADATFASPGGMLAATR
jgi:hypothetical protein